MSAVGLVLLAVDGGTRRTCRGDSIEVEKNREDGSFDTLAEMEGRVAKSGRRSWRTHWKSMVEKGAVGARTEAIISSTKRKRGSICECPRKVCYSPVDGGRQ